MTKVDSAIAILVTGLAFGLGYAVARKDAPAVALVTLLLLLAAATSTAAGHPVRGEHRSPEAPVDPLVIRVRGDGLA
jgi:hypothetical protein